MLFGSSARIGSQIDFIFCQRSRFGMLPRRFADESGELAGNLANYGLGSLLTGIAVDASGNVFFEELSPSFRRIREVTPGGNVTTVAGNGGAGYSGDGGPAANALLNPAGDELGNTLAIDHTGNLYVADGGNNAVRILRPVKP